MHAGGTSGLQMTGSLCAGVEMPDCSLLGVSPQGHTLLGFLDAISCDLEKHDLSDIRSTVPENSTTVSVFKPGTEEKYLEDGDNGDDDPSLADMPHLTSSTRGENGSHEAASRFPQQNDKRKPSAFQPYRKRPHENGSGKLTCIFFVVMVITSTS